MGHRCSPHAELIEIARRVRQRQEHGRDPREPRSLRGSRAQHESRRSHGTTQAHPRLLDAFLVIVGRRATEALRERDQSQRPPPRLDRRERMGSAGPTVPLLCRIHVLDPLSQRDRRCRRRAHHTQSSGSGPRWRAQLRGRDPAATACLPADRADRAELLGVVGP